jgi:hypothetical protein
MRNAPAVHYPVGRSHFHGWLLLLAGGLGFLVIGGWHLTGNVEPGRTSSFAVIALVLAVNALFQWHSTAVGELVWTGLVWQFSRRIDNVESSPLTIHDVRVVLDLQSTLLIRAWGADGETNWLWSEQRQMPPLWWAHRRALFAVKPALRREKSGSAWVDDLQFPGSTVEALPPKL